MCKLQHLSIDPPDQGGWIELSAVLDHLESPAISLNATSTVAGLDNAPRWQAIRQASQTFDHFRRSFYFRAITLHLILRGDLFSKSQKGEIIDSVVPDVRRVQEHAHGDERERGSLDAEPTEQTFLKAISFCFDRGGSTWREKGEQVAAAAIETSHTGNYSVLVAKNDGFDGEDLKHLHFLQGFIKLPATEMLAYCKHVETVSRLLRYCHRRIFQSWEIERKAFQALSPNLALLRRIGQQNDGIATMTRERHFWEEILGQFCDNIMEFGSSAEFETMDDDTSSSTNSQLRQALWLAMHANILGPIVHRLTFDSRLVDEGNKVTPERVAQFFNAFAAPWRVVYALRNFRFKYPQAELRMSPITPSRGPGIPQEVKEDFEESMSYPFLTGKEVLRAKKMVEDGEESVRKHCEMQILDHYYSYCNVDVDGQNSDTTIGERKPAVPATGTRVYGYFGATKIACLLCDLHLRLLAPLFGFDAAARMPPPLHAQWALPNALASDREDVVAVRERILVGLESGLLTAERLLEEKIPEAARQGRETG